MTRILDRYVFREVIPSFLLGIFVFTFVILLNEILRFAQRLVSQSASLSDTLGILLNLLPSVLCLTIPMGFLLGVLIALGRLAADSEIIAMRASGVSLYRLLSPILFAAALAWGATSYLIIEVLPDSNQRVRQLFFKILTSHAGTEVRPRVFYDRLFPNLMFLVLDTPTDVSYWENVILADLSDPQSPRLTFANQGQLLIDPDARTVTFYLKDAELHQVSHRRPAEYQRQISKEIFLPLPTDTFFPPEDLNVPRGARELSLAQLRASYTEKGEPVYLTEIHKKFSIPFACFVFGVLGLALGVRNRRDGRSWGFIVSLVVIFVYYILIDIGENMAISGRLSPLLGMWAPNIILGTGALALLLRAARESHGGFPKIDVWWPALGSKLRGWRRDRKRTPGKTVILLRVPRVTVRFPNTLDRYVGREFTRFFVLILLALVNVYVLGLLIDVIADAFENNIQGKLVLQYLAFAQPQILFHMLPLSTLMATLVCFAILTKTSELTAAKAGGISLYRLAVPAVLMGVIVSAGCFALQEYLLPFANRRAAELRDEIKKSPVQTYNVMTRKWMMGEKPILYNYAYYDPLSRKFSGLAVYKYETDPFDITERLYAEEAIWEADIGAWVFAKGWKRNFDEGRQIERFETLPVHDMEPPSYFVKEQKRSDQMTYLELSRYVEDLKQAGYDVVPLEVARQAKFSFPLAAMVTVLIGVPFSFAPGKKGAIYGLGIAIALGLAYYVTTRIFAFMGETAMLPPLLAAWAPNVLFSIAALYGLFNVRT
jgi:LPS export ABC transporter permease LptG/LPS export ABC transporter permease LptF